MRPFRSVIVGVIAVASVFAVTAPANAATVSYASLGDSYASGVGTGSESGSCAQSPTAFGPLWASQHGATFTFAACTGAKTTDVVNSQVSSLSSSTTLVSVLAGGNDVGFASIMQSCVLGSDTSCQSAVAAAETYARNTLPGQLKTMYAAIRSHAPNAKVVALDYPVFYDLSVSVCVGLSTAKHEYLDEGINVLDDSIKSAAASAGVTFADVRAQFVGHQLCDGSGWLHSTNVTNVGESYHPTATGHSSGYLPVFTSAAG